MSQVLNHPERHMGARCGAMVEKGHVGYQCTRPQGHSSAPPDDPEPCYAVEVPASLFRWQAWNERQQNPMMTVDGTEPKVSDGAFTVQIIASHCENVFLHAAHLYSKEEWAEGNHYCDGTGLRPDEILVDPSEYPEWLEVYGSPGPTVAEMPALIQRYREASAPSPRISEDKKPLRMQYHAEQDDPVRIVPSKAWEDTQIAAQARARQFMDCGERCLKSGTHDAADPQCVLRPVQGMTLTVNDGPVETSVPTKQREGDQPLPIPGVTCVQDVIIAAMEESKRVGKERYGSTLHTFNGRKTIQDIAEEARDLFIYATQMSVEADADRDTLIEVVTAALTSYPGQTQLEGDPENAAERAVDAIMGWVAGRPEPVSDDVFSTPSGHE